MGVFLEGTHSNGEDVDFVFFVLDKDRNVLVQDTVVVVGKNDIPNDDQHRSGVPSVVTAVHVLLLLVALAVV
jgi:hypothetical protein